MTKSSAAMRWRWPLNELAAELGVSHWNLRDWTKGGERKKAAPPATAEEMPREMTGLRRENESPKARCEVLEGV